MSAKIENEKRIARAKRFAKGLALILALVFGGLTLLIIEGMGVSGGFLTEHRVLTQLMIIFGGYGYYYLFENILLSIVKEKYEN